VENSKQHGFTTLKRNIRGNLISRIGCICKKADGVETAILKRLFYFLQITVLFGHLRFKQFLFHSNIFSLIFLLFALRGIIRTITARPDLFWYYIL